MGITQSTLELLISLKDDATAGLGNLAGSLGGVAGIAGGAVVAGLGAAGVAAFNFASDSAQGVNDLQASLGLTEGQAQRLGDVAQDVFANNWYNSVGEATAAVGEIQKQLGNLSDDTMAQVAGSVAAIGDSFGAEAPEVINAVKSIRDNFPGTTEAQALDFITAGFQRGLDSSGDFLDSIGEYSTQFSNGGADAGQFFSLLESGLQGGVLGTDKAADAFKEFRLRIGDGSDATEDALKRLNLADLNNQLAEGSITAVDAFQQVQDAIAKVESPAYRMQIGAALIGTQFEDMGDSAFAAINLTSTSLDGLAGATDSLNAKYDNWPAMWEGIKRSTLVAIAPIGESLLGIANDAMPVVQAGFNWLAEGLPPIIDQAVAFINSFTASGAQAGATLGPVIQELANFWQATLLPAIQEVADFFMSDVLPILQDLATAAIPVVVAALQLLAGIWANVLQPALSAVWNFFRGSIIPILKEVAQWLAQELPPAIATATDFFNNQILPAIRAVHQFLTGSLIPGLRDGVTWIGNVATKAAELATSLGNTLQGAINTVADLLRTALAPAIAGIQSAIDSGKSSISSMAGWLQGIANAASNAVDWVKEVADAIASVKVPDWLQGHSPPPMADWFNWIADAAERVTNAAPTFTTASIPEMPAAIGSGSGSGNSEITVKVELVEDKLRGLMKAEVSDWQEGIERNAGRRRLI